MRHLINDYLTDHFTDGLDMETLTQLLALEWKGERIVEGENRKIWWTQDRLYILLNGMECRKMIWIERNWDNITHIHKAS